MGACASAKQKDPPNNQAANQNNGSASTATNGSGNRAQSGNSQSSNAPPPAPAPAPPAQRSTQRSQNDRSVREVPLVQQLIRVDAEKIYLKRQQSGNYQLEFKCDVLRGDAEVLQKFNGQLRDPEDNNVLPEIVDVSTDAFRKKVSTGVGKNVRISEIPPGILKTCSSPKEKELPSEIPLILHVRSLKENYNSPNVNAVWLMCNLQLKGGEEGSDYDVHVLKKSLARGGRGYLHQNLFGAIMPPYAKTDNWSGGGGPNEPQECVVCLTAPREV